MDVPQRSPTGGTKCYRCGSTHAASHCRFKDYVCHRCGKRGHISRVCKVPRAAGGADRRQEQEAGPDMDDLILRVNIVGNSVVKPYMAILEVNGQRLKMEIDTGAAVTLISQATQKALFPQAELQKSTVTLRTYTTEPLGVVGQMEVKVRHRGYEGTHTLYVVKGKGPSLLGRNWLSHIQLDEVKIQQTSSPVLAHYDLGWGQSCHIVGRTEQRDQSPLCLEH